LNLGDLRTRHRLDERNHLARKVLRSQVTLKFMHRQTMTEAALELLVRGGEWALASPGNGALAFLLLLTTAILAVPVWSLLLRPALTWLTFPLWWPLRCRRRLRAIRWALHHPAGITALSVLNQLAIAGHRKSLPGSAADRDWAGRVIWAEDKDLPVRYPDQIYELRVPRRLIKEVRALMSLVGREEGWICRAAPSGGQLELISNNFGFRL
jgi:hypothetical protein